MVCVVFDPHQSPIWFKAIVLLAQITQAPSASADQKIIGAMPVPFLLLQIIWFKPTPLRLPA